MRIKSFIASTVQEALKSVKREMGDDSIILETRNIEEGDIKSKDGQVLVEVVAAEYNNGQNAGQNEDQEDGQDVQGDSGNLDPQSPGKNPLDSSQSYQQQSKQNTSVTELKDLPDDQVDNVTLADHLHSDDLDEPADSTPSDRLSGLSETAQADEVGQVSKWIVDSRVENSKHHVSHEIINNGGNSNILSPTRYQSESLRSGWYPSEKYSSVKKQTGILHGQMNSVTLADHLLTEDLIELAGDSKDEITAPLIHHQDSDSNYGDWPGQSRGLFKQLLIQQVEEEHSRILINEAMCRLSKDEYDKKDLCCQMLRESIIHKIKISDSFFNNQDESKTMVFVGAAGTGKTTTISKLASYTRKRSDKEILLISIRGHSAEKLQKTAGRIGATLRTVTSHLELRGIIDKYEGNSHIFIDTPGISYLDDNALSGLKGFLDEMPNMETHLVVSTTTRYADIINIINKFTVFPIHRLLFTRVDETCLYGTLFSVAMETQIPLSCISDGQEIPEDIRPVTAEMVADMVLQV